ncbi:hypothetical protein C8J56DRAFT_1125465 [Mycena floridula]|nr:hypothetical protein C8J56DRAFT_1125465 [Mycena floridula]
MFILTVTALIGFCIFLAEDPPFHFETIDTLGFYHSTPMEELVCLVSPLAEGYPRAAQRAYSAAIWLIMTIVKTSWTLQIPSKWRENATLNQIVGRFQVAQYLKGEKVNVSLSTILEDVTTFTGLNSALQMVVAHPLRSWLTKDPPGLTPDDQEHVSSLFHLLGTLDDPKAVAKVQQTLGDFIAAPPKESRHIQRNHELELEVALDALRRLEMTASQSGFILKALSLVVADGIS